jgi:hypothetical protein
VRKTYTKLTPCVGAILTLVATKVAGWKSPLKLSIGGITISLNGPLMTDEMMRELYALRLAVADIRSTCQGQLDGESKRATYLGIRNYIDRQFPHLVPHEIEGNVAT